MIVRGQIHEHLKTGNYYVVECLCSIKVNGKWEPGVAYYPSGSSDDSPELYVRTLENFTEKFKEIRF